jgi:ANTAR domain-containing protein/GAF domain-containing protein
MSDDEKSDELAWAAERRDFVADWRDGVAADRDTHADVRDATADEREQRADDREAELDELERSLDDRAVELGLPPTRTPAERERAAAERVQGAVARDEAREERQKRAEDRDGAAAARRDAAERRERATPTTQLAVAFAEIARHLYQAENFADVLTRIVMAAVSTVRGCEMASVTVRDDAGYRTVASTHDAATKSDGAQYESGEGPCLDAIEEPVVYAAAFPDPRWPVLAARPTESGVESVVSYRLMPSRPDPAGSLAGSLNAYADTPDAFDDEAREIGLILAAHASVAAGAMREREALQEMSHNLHEALSSRDVIGQAKGILMERLQVTPEDAFDALRRSSQRLNIKLREVAATLAETGEFQESSIKPRQ